MCIFCYQTSILQTIKLLKHDTWLITRMKYSCNQFSKIRDITYIHLLTNIDPHLGVKSLQFYFKF